jgi:hypothetical protein
VLGSENLLSPLSAIVLGPPVYTIIISKTSKLVRHTDFLKNLSRFFIGRDRPINKDLFALEIYIFLVCYLGASITCALLAINRFFEILFPKVAKVLYSKTMMLLWYSIAIGYMISMWFNAPTFFSIAYLANYLDPFKGIEGFGENAVVINLKKYINSKILF